MRQRKNVVLILICSIMVLHATVPIVAGETQTHPQSIMTNSDSGIYYKYNILFGICDFIDIRIGGYGVPRVNTHMTHGIAIGLIGNPHNDNMVPWCTLLKNATIQWLWDGQNIHGFVFPPFPTLFHRHFICFLTYDCTIEK